MHNKTKVAADEQLGAGKLFYGSDSSATAHVEQSAAEREEEMDDDYLRNGKKILSILREREKNKPLTFKQSEFLDAINPDTYRKKDGKDKKKYVLQTIAQKVIRPAIADVSGPDGLDAFKKLLPGFAEQMTFSTLDKDIMRGYHQVTGEYDGIGLVVNIPWDASSEEAERPAETVMTAGKTRLTGKNGHSLVSRETKRVARFVDTGIYFAAAALIVHLRERILDIIEGMEDFTKHPVYVKVMSYLYDRLEQATDVDGNVYITKRAYKRSFVHKFLRENGVPKNQTLIAYKKNIDIFKSVRVADIDDFTPLYLVTRDFPVSELPIGSLSLFRILVDKMEWDDIKQYNKAVWYYSVLNVGIQSDICIDVLNAILQEYSEDKNEWEMLTRMKREYARSFETKRNIPKHIVNAMKKSEYNTYFGYIEYDEEVDLALVEKVKDQFFSVAEFIGLKKHPEVSLRFRKLYNHHAKGLYYPVLKCLCVDVRHQDSFAHELYHMIDYENGKLSRKPNFHKTLTLYREALTDTVNNMGDEESKSLKGRGKYNLSYYMNASEVFACCGEIYLTRICGINNSIVKSEQTFAYPNTPELDQSIREYFSSLVDSEESVKPDAKQECFSSFIDSAGSVKPDVRQENNNNMKYKEMTREERSMRKKVKIVSDALDAARPYMRANIYPELEKLSRNDEEFSLFKSYADGCYLANAPFMQSYEVKYYPLEGDGHFYAIAEMEGNAYGFLFAPADDYAQYVSLNTDELNNRKAKKREMFFYSDKVSKVTGIFEIPYVEVLPDKLRKPIHKTITNIMEDSEWYLKNIIYPRIQDSVEWNGFSDYLFGFVLAHNQKVMELEVKEHYREDNVDYLVFEREHFTMHCFIIEKWKHGRKLMRYGRCRLDETKKVKNSKFVYKTMGYAVSVFDIPPVHEIPDLL